MAVQATRLPSGKWRCKANYTDEQGHYKAKSFTRDTKRAAELAAAAFVVEQKHDAKPENATLGELVDRFIDSRSNLLSPSTIVGYRKIRRTAFQSIVDCRIGLLTKQQYQKAINEYSQGRAYKTVLSAHSLFNQVMKDNGISIGDGVLLPQKEKDPIDIPTIEEVEKLLTQTAGTRLELYCLLAVCLGLRKSEIIALQWKDIDLVNKTISINKARVKDEFGTYVVKATKTSEGTRTLHLPEHLTKALGDEREPNEYVISDSPDALDSLYKRLQKKLDFPYNFHALRHFYASVMLQIGIPNKYAKARMGHATEDMLQNVYQHIFNTKQEEYDVALDDFYAQTFFNTVE